MLPMSSLSGGHGVHWVKPTLVVAVEYAERTRDGLLRIPSFVGIREDIEPEEVASIGATLEEAAHVSPPAARHASSGAVEVAGIALTHPERILYPELGVTKLALARYYESIQAWVLPWLVQRPLVLLRCPEGREACFYQKHLPKSQARAVPRIAIPEGAAMREYVYVRSLADIVALVQHEALELHAWGCRVDDIEHPDLLVFDLDPAPDVAWNEVLRTARELRERLQQLGLTAFPRTTGGKGLHLVVPLQPEADWATAKAFAKLVAEQHAHDEPHLLTTNMALAKRHDLYRLPAQRTRCYRDRQLLGARAARCAGGCAAALGRAGPRAAFRPLHRGDAAAPPRRAACGPVGRLLRGGGSAGCGAAPCGDFMTARFISGGKLPGFAYLQQIQDEVQFVRYGLRIHGCES
jgi:DNA ligase D